jgi:H/ACA ribonucleoprotein complex subunit 3
MSGHIRRCDKDRTYTLKNQCPVCGEATRTAHPPRFSPEDRFGKYRRLFKDGRYNNPLS